MTAADLTLAQMRAIREIASKGSFSSAARSLMVSQSTLTRTIQEAERALQYALFIRSTRVVQTTPICDELLPVLRNVLVCLDDGLVSVENYARVQRGALSVAVLPSVAAVLLPPVLRYLRDKHRDLELNVWDEPHDEVESLLLSGTADIALTTCIDRDERFAKTPRWEEDFYAVASPPAPWGMVAEVRWKSLFAQPFIATRSGTSIRELVDSAREAVGGAPFAHLGVATVAALGGLIRSKLGVTALPALELAGYRLDDLVATPLREPTGTRTLGIVALVDKPPTPAVRVFCEAVDSVINRIGYPAGVRPLQP